MRRDIRDNVTRVISGGQTGVDRGALDAAILLGIEHGGWCPRGRLAEDGPIPPQYDLWETESPEYPVRTEQNVTDSDGTLLLFRRRLTGGTRYTLRMARRHGRPHFQVDLEQPWDIPAVQTWLAEHDIQVLNVAGPRASTSPRIQDDAREFVLALLNHDSPRET
ncbi:MAG: putative molybdenum carrier protein [Planctomycetales bacterium]|nr:putative molybdenum carrier protein [Planctomycetales bacterium]